jgi:DNA-binding GntR family transcriptional regulator
MGTSNGPVREALRQLEDLGLVVCAPRRGTFVAELTAQLARDVFSLRALLEVAALRLTVADLSDAGVERFEEVLEDMGRYPDGPSSSPRLLVDCDLRFHDILLDFSRHRLLQQSWQRLRAQARVLLIVTGALWNQEARSARERAEGMVEVHLPLVEAIRARHVTRSEALFVAHLAEGERRIIRKMAPAEPDRSTLVDRMLRSHPHLT